MDELVTPRTTRQAARARRGACSRFEAVEPLLVAAGIVWALAQPYRVAFFYPRGQGPVGLGRSSPVSSSRIARLPAILVTPELVEDMERHEVEDVDAAEVAHWLFAGGFLFLGLVLLAEAVMRPDIVVAAPGAMPLAVARALRGAVSSG